MSLPILVRSEIEDLVADGWSLAAIAKDKGVSYTTVYNFVNKRKGLNGDTYAIKCRRKRHLRPALDALDANPDREDFYDREVSPLMEEIIRVCKERDIPFMACFQLSDGSREQDEGDPMMCTTSLMPQEWASESLVKAVRCVYGRPQPFAAMVTSTGPDGVVTVEQILGDQS